MLRHTSQKFSFTKLVLAAALLASPACVQESFTSHGAGQIIAGEPIRFGASEIPVPTAIHFVIDASPSMIPKQVSLGNALRGFMTDLYHSMQELGLQSDVQISISTSTMFKKNQTFSHHAWPRYPRFDANNQWIQYDLTNDPMPGNITEYENPFSRIAVTKMLDSAGQEVQSIPRDLAVYKGYSIDYDLITEPLVASFRVNNTDPLSKFNQVGDSLYAAMQVGGKGDSIEYSLLSAYRNVFDNILPNLQSGGANVGNVITLIVSDEDSSEHRYRGTQSSPVSAAVLSSKIIGEPVARYEWVEKSICDADPTGCRDYPNPSGDEIAEIIRFNYVWVEVAAKCNKLVDGVPVYGDHSRYSFTFCHKYGANICKFPVGPLSDPYASAAADAIGCTGATSDVRVTKVVNGSSGLTFEYDPNLNRLKEEFTHNGTTYKNAIANRIAAGMSTSNYVRIAPAVQKSRSDLVQIRHEHEYVNEEIKALSEAKINSGHSDQAEKAKVPAALGRAFVDRLKNDPRVSGFYVGGIVNLTEPTGSNVGAKATSILSTIDYAKANGGGIGDGQAFSVTQSSFNFIQDVLGELIQKSAVSSYVLPIKEGYVLTSVVIQGPDGKSRVISYTADRQKLDNNVALVEDRTITFNIKKLREVLGITTNGSSLAKALEGYKIIPQFLRN